jgi:hypothetical protein
MGRVMTPNGMELGQIRSTMTMRDEARHVREVLEFKGLE